MNLDTSGVDAYTLIVKNRIFASGVNQREPKIFFAEDGTPAAGGCHVHIIHAQQDARFLRQLEGHLIAIGAEFWHRGQVNPGEQIIKQRQASLRRSRYIVLLLSVDLLRDHQDEIRAAFARRSKAIILPVLVRPMVLPHELRGIQALPRNNKPITNWKSRDKAWMEVVSALR